MENMEDKLGAILSNPQMMQQIMSMAQSLGAAQQTSASPPQHPPQPQPPALPNIDLGMIQKLSGLMNDCNVTQEETALLRALSPYLTRDRISKLEKAMRAAKMARFASSFLNAGGLQMLSGR